jgi:hypothetical protein
MRWKLRRSMSIRDEGCSFRFVRTRTGAGTRTGAEGILWCSMFFSNLSIQALLPYFEPFSFTWICTF